MDQIVLRAGLCFTSSVVFMAVRRLADTCAILEAGASGSGEGAVDALFLERNRSVCERRKGRRARIRSLVRRISGRFARLLGSSLLYNRALGKMSLSVLAQELWYMSVGEAH